VHTALMAQLELCEGTRLWQHTLFRDNCTVRANGSYFKDLARLDRPMGSVVMVDNLSNNFAGFEYNGLPINEYYGHQGDAELAKLEKVVGAVMHSKVDVRGVLHSAALKEEFSAYKLNSMLYALDWQRRQMQMQEKVVDIDDELCTSDEDGADSVPCSATASASLSLSDEASNSSMSLSGECSIEESIEEMSDAELEQDIEESCKNLDFYLFNLVAHSQSD